MTDLSDEVVIREMERQLGRKLTPDERHLLWLAEAAKKAVESKTDQPTETPRSSRH